MRFNPKYEQVQKFVEVPRIEKIQKFVDVPVTQQQEQIIEIPKVFFCRRLTGLDVHSSCLYTKKFIKKKNLFNNYYQKPTDRDRGGRCGA